jgi:hypothetical protein
MINVNLQTSNKVNICRGVMIILIIYVIIRLIKGDHEKRRHLVISSFQDFRLKICTHISSPRAYYISHLSHYPCFIQNISLDPLYR